MVYDMMIMMRIVLIIIHKKFTSIARRLYKSVPLLKLPTC